MLSTLKTSARAAASKLNKQATRAVFGNTVARHRNLAGARNWWRARRAFDGDIDRGAHERFKVVRYQRLAEGTVDADVVRAIAQRFDQVVMDDQFARCPFSSDATLQAKYNYGGLQGPLPLVRREINDALAAIPQIRELFDARVLGALRTCLGSNFTVDEVDAWRNFHVPDEVRAKFEATNDRWHFDHHQCDRLRLFINITDVGAEDGPTEFFDHPTSRELIKHGYENAKRAQSETGGIPPELVRSHPNKLSCAGASGAAVALQTSYCLHRGGTRLPGRHRDLLAFTMVPSAQLSVLGALRT